MRRVLAAEAAELREFDPLCRLLLVLRRAVVPALAVAAGQMNDVSHCCSCGQWALGFRLADKPRADSRTPKALLEDLRNRPGTDRAAALANREARALLERHRRVQRRLD